MEDWIYGYFLPLFVGQRKTKDTVLASNLVEPRFGVCIHLEQPDKDSLFSTQKGHQLLCVPINKTINLRKSQKVDEFYEEKQQNYHREKQASSRSLSPWPPHGLREKVSSKLLYLKSWQPFTKHEKDLRAHKRCYKRSHENLPRDTEWVLRDFQPDQGYRLHQIAAKGNRFKVFPRATMPCKSWNNCFLGELQQAIAHKGDSMLPGGRSRVDLKKGGWPRATHCDGIFNDDLRRSHFAGGELGSPDLGSGLIW